MTLQQLVYQSRSVAALSSDELRHLLAAWRRNNHGLHITGLLLYGEEQIVQVIEGPAAAVHQLYRRIAQDRRHHEVVTLADGPVTARTFPEWSMGFATLQTPDLNRLAGYIDPARLATVLPAAPAGLVDLLQEFVARQVTGH